MQSHSRSGLLSIAYAMAVFLCAHPIPAHAQDIKQEIRQRDKPADAAELSQITARGRELAAYDAAAWHATDEVQALHPVEGAIRMYIGKQTSAGWVMAFGKLNATRDAFLILYETTPTKDINHPRVTVNTPPEEDRDQWLHEALAYDNARSIFTHPDRPYNGAVLPATDGWYVYFYPAQTKTGVFPLGADVRYRYSEDGLKLEETHRMHASILEFNVNEQQKTKMVYRTAFLDDAPEDTDVATVLMMGGVPMLISGRNFTYQIGADGSPAFVIATKAFVKGAKK